MQRRPDSCATGKEAAHRVGIGHSWQRHARDVLIQRIAIPVIRFGTTQARMARLNREARPFIPFRYRAGVVGHRPAAADLVQAPAFARAFVIEILTYMPASKNARR